MGGSLPFFHGNSLGDLGLVTHAQPNLTHRIVVRIKWRKEAALGPLCGKRQDIEEVNNKHSQMLVGPPRHSWTVSEGGKG